MSGYHNIGDISKVRENSKPYDATAAERAKRYRDRKKLKSQFHDFTAAERAKRYREKKKNSATPDKSASERHKAYRAKKKAQLEELRSSSSENVKSQDVTAAQRNMRKSYRGNKDAFTEDQLVSKTDPFAQFADWFEKIKGVPEIMEPNAMCLATCNKDGQPSARFVLLKGFGKDVGGFTFFTNYNSRKGSDLEQNSKAGLTFYWDKLNRQIRIEGVVSKVPEEENEVYFRRRPLASQIGAAASEQSTVIESRDVLIEKAEEIAKSCNGTVEKPSHWGGYLLVPHFFEFWQGQSDRLHDRICFKREKETDPWTLFRLAP